MSRKPRDLAAYKPAAQTAAWLRNLANQMEIAADAYPLVKVRVDLWNWNPDWETKKNRKVADDAL